MLKAIGKLFSSVFGNPSPSGKSFHPSRTCPECGSKLYYNGGWGEQPVAAESCESGTKTDPREPKRDSKTADGSPGLRRAEAASVAQAGVSPHPDTENVPAHQTTGSEDLGSIWRCPNPDCPAQVRARIEHWCSPAAMDIAGGEAALVAKLVGKGLVRDVAELYRLKVAEIAAIEGMDRNSAKKCFDAIMASRKREAWRLLFGLSIPQVGATEAKSLCRHFALVDNVFAASAERLMQAEGVSAEAARSLVQWHSDGMNRKLVRRLFKAGLNFNS